jgi:capsular exopolysaccharide synthesis family protein
MDLGAYIKPLQRWWWLLLAAILVAVVSTFLTVRRQPSFYEARTTLMIGRAIDDPNPTQGEFSLAGQLAISYADVAKREPVREATKAALGLDRLPPYVARAAPGSQLIEIVVTDANPLRAQVVANELANQLILRSPTSEGSQDQIRRDFIFGQLDDLQTQILDAQDEIVELQEQLGVINSASELQDTRNQITALQQKLTTLQATYGTLLSNTQQGATNTLTIVESAGLPTRPIGSNKTIIIALAAGIGFSLAAGAAYLLDYMDNTFKTPEEVTELLGLPVIGFIGETNIPEGDKNGLYVSHYPRSPVAEAYRTLRSNLKFMSVDKPLRSILITSDSVGAGKTSVAANLSSVIAQGDKKVFLIDVDLRRPSVHELFNVQNEYGLANMFQDGLNVYEAVTVIEGEKFGVITSGQSPPNPAELLTSERMDQILARLEDLVDVVILDSAPSIFADTFEIASKVDGVLLVVQPGHTRKKAALAMIEQLKVSDARILGVVFNRVPQKELANYGYYYSPYYSNGHYSDEDRKYDLQGNLQQYLEGIRTGISRFRERYINR